MMHVDTAPKILHIICSYHNAAVSQLVMNFIYSVHQYQRIRNKSYRKHLKTLTLLNHGVLKHGVITGFRSESISNI